MSRYRNTSNANPLNTLLTACNAPQRASRHSASTDRLSSVELSNRLLVGRMTTSVNGITEPSRTPPTSHQNGAPTSHAAMDDRKPTAAKVACIIVLGGSWAEIRSPPVLRRIPFLQ